MNNHAKALTDAIIKAVNEKEAERMARRYDGNPVPHDNAYYDAIHEASEALEAAVREAISKIVGGQGEE